MLNEFKKFAMRGNVADMACRHHHRRRVRNNRRLAGERFDHAAVGLLPGRVDFATLFLVLKDGVPPGP
jgi:large conductance mechanosensitive channel